MSVTGCQQSSYNGCSAHLGIYTDPTRTTWTTRRPLKTQSSDVNQNHMLPSPSASWWCQTWTVDFGGTDLGLTSFSGTLTTTVLGGGAVTCPD